MCNKHISSYHSLTPRDTWSYPVWDFLRYFYIASEMSIVNKTKTMVIRLNVAFNFNKSNNKSICRSQKGTGIRFPRSESYFDSGIIALFKEGSI